MFRTPNTTPSNPKLVLISTFLRILYTKKTYKLRSKYFQINEHLIQPGNQSKLSNTSVTYATHTQPRNWPIVLKFT